MLNIFSKKDRMILRSDMWNLGFITDDIADVIKSDKLNIHWMKRKYSFRMVCDGMKPQTKTLRVEWTGMWRSRKSELLSVLGYEWTDNE